MAEFTTKPLIQNGRITLHPTPYGDVIYREPTLRHDLLQIAVAERVSQIPPDAQNDNHILEVAPTEQGRTILGHQLTLPDPPGRVCNRSNSLANASVHL